ncbi:MAG: four helix bundle protein [Bacteroidota bacterium]|nr:four helix bundle protein [Bacteroidota bacterium]
MEYTLETLEVYLMAEEFSAPVWNFIQEWDSFKKDTIGKQLARAADSISANIAEGYGRYFYKKSKQFYFYARGSIQETKAWLSTCKRRKIIEAIEVDTLLLKADGLLFKLNAYIKFVAASPKHNRKPNQPLPPNPLIAQLNKHGKKQNKSWF